MKSYLPFIALMGLLFYAPNLLAQCTVIDRTISNVRRTADNNCTLKFDLTFKMQNNNGNKTIAIHLWPSSSYPNPTLTYSKAPDSVALKKPYGTILIDNDKTIPTTYPVYTIDSRVKVLTPKSITKTVDATGTATFVLTDISIDNTGCSGIVDIIGDIWSTNSGGLNGGTTPQCSSKGVAIKIGDPALSAPFKTCGSVRYLNFSVSTQNNSPIAVKYDIYKDDGTLVGTRLIFDPSKDLPVTIGGTQTISVNQIYSATNVPFQGNDVVGENSEYWVVITYSDGTNTFSTAEVSTSACAPLPVRFSDFTATRNKNTVLLKWQTAMESNNRGFYVQRLLGSGEWQNIAYVFSQASNGNSTSPLDYKYTDNNVYSGLTQYRIVQQDLDYRTHLSDIRAVRGESNQSGIVVFPNPSLDGKVMLVFGEPGVARDLTVTDMSGRTVKVLRSVTNNTVTLTNLVSGMYTVHVTNLANATTTVEKIVVTKR